MGGWKEGNGRKVGRRGVLPAQCPVNVATGQTRQGHKQQQTEGPSQHGLPITFSLSFLRFNSCLSFETLVTNSLTCSQLVETCLVCSFNNSFVRMEFDLIWFSCIILHLQNCVFRQLDSACMSHSLKSCIYGKIRRYTDKFMENGIKDSFILVQDI